MIKYTTHDLRAVEAAEKLRIVSGIQIYLRLECEKQNRGNNSKKTEKEIL